MNSLPYFKKKTSPLSFLALFISLYRENKKKRKEKEKRERENLKKERDGERERVLISLLLFPP